MQNKKLKMKRIIINGANGYVASNLIEKLLSTTQYEVIAFARGNKKLTAAERIKDVLAEINDLNDRNYENLKVYNYSLNDEDFAMDESVLKEIFSREVEYFHFAASLKYDYKSREEIFSTNINGVENSIRVFSKYAKGNSRFFFIGTAYSCGKFPGLFEEKFYKNEDISVFRNYYEQSKRFAENVVKQHIDKEGLNAHIIRLSQVVGNNKSGKTTTDYGIFDFSKRIYKLASRHPNQTIRVHVDSEATQNLIPIDTVVDYLVKTISANEVPVIMNFISRHSVKNKLIIESLNKLLPVNIIPVKDINRKEMNAMERMVAVGMSFTGSYIDTQLLFDTRQRDKIIDLEDNETRDDSVFRMIEYFIDRLEAMKKGQTTAQTT
jgi:nucleoside-diphosphate-sugar epimerase